MRLILLNELKQFEWLALVGTMIDLRMEEIFEIFEIEIEKWMNEWMRRDI